MSLAHISEWDAYLTCPYDKSHTVIARRFQNHLTKCARNHPDKKLSKCPFNSSHRYPEEDRANHIRDCPDRVFVEREIVNQRLPNVDYSVLQKKVVHVYDLPESTEDWDTECKLHPVKSYDPSKALESSQFRNPATLSHMKPAEKKKFHKQLLSEQRSGASTPASMAENVDEDYDDLHSVRLPREQRKIEKKAMPTVRLSAGRGRGLMKPSANTSESIPGHCNEGLALGRGLPILHSDNDAVVGNQGRHINTDESDVLNQLSKLDLNDNGT